MPVQVNLRPKQINESSTNYLFEWFSTKGKYILLLINILLFGVYVYRYYLDRENSLLSDKIVSLNTAITSYESKALKYNDLQVQAKLISTREAGNVDESFVLDTISSSIPKGVKLTVISVTGREIKITSQSSEPTDFSSFISFLVSKERVTSLILESSRYLQNNNSYETEFTLTYK